MAIVNSNVVMIPFYIATGDRSSDFQYRVSSVLVAPALATSIGVQPR